MNIELYIENQLIELDEAVSFAITKQFEDIANPTTIINDWSKTISIPFSANNNKIFGNIYQLDRVTLAGDYKQMGIYFDPTQKLDFKLQYNQSVIMSGYAKMSSIKQSGGKGTYELNLFGALGKVFQEMKRITFDSSSSDVDSIIDSNLYVHQEINKELVAKIWATSSQTSDKIETVEANEIIGFAPNNSYNDEFDSSNVQLNSNSAKKFEDILNNTEAFKANNIPASAIIGDGVTPRGYGEYRSYYQLPYIYFNKLFKIFQAKAEQVTNYAFMLDPTWFDKTNPYWYDLVYMLKPLDVKNGHLYENYYTLKGTNTMEWSRTSAGGNLLEVMETSTALVSKNESLPIMDSQAKIALDESSIAVWNDTLQFRLYGNISGVSTTSQMTFSQYAYLIIRVHFYSEGDYHESQVICVCREDVIGTLPQSITPDLYYYIPAQSSLVTDTQQGWNININLNPHRLIKSVFGDKVRMVVNCRFLSLSNPFSSSNETTVKLDLVKTNSQVEVKSGLKRSRVHFSLNDLWDNEYNLFSEILKYCKIFNLVILVDDLKRTITFQRKTTYFRSYTIQDWSSKLDISKDLIIEPITFGSKYVLFNYQDSKCKLNQKYKQKYNVNYGELKLKTDYNFNTNTENLFEEPLSPSLVVTDNVLDWNALYGGNVCYTFANERYPDVKDQEGKYVANFGSYYFHNGLGTFDTSLRSVRVTDDTAYQQSFNAYMYAENLEENSTKVTTYPLLDIMDKKGQNLCVFNVPRECYTYGQNYSTLTSIYTNFWEKYVQERYNIQNKKVTCYLWLTPTDFMGFQFNHFVKINNQLYMVNKIYDYDVTANKPTKVDLISIQDIDAYTKDNYKYSYIYTSPTNVVTSVGNEFTIKVYSNCGMMVGYDQSSYEITPTSSSKEVTDVTIKVLNSSVPPISFMSSNGTKSSTLTITLE